MQTSTSYPGMRHLRAFSMLQPLLTPPSFSTSFLSLLPPQLNNPCTHEVPRTTARPCSSGASPWIVAPTCKMPAGLGENKPPWRGPAVQEQAGSVQYWARWGLPSWAAGAGQALAHSPQHGPSSCRWVIQAHL